MPIKDFFAKHRQLILTLCVGAVLVALHIPFYFAHRVEDDSFIFFTCGKNLADTGVYGFNPGEKVSVCTSHFYVSIIAFSRLVFGRFFTQAVMFFNVIMLLWALYIFSSLFFQDRKKRLILWSASSIIPAALLMTDKGMETPLLLLLVAIIFGWIYTQKAGISTYAALFLIPFTRPDWAVFIFLPMFFLAFKNKKFEYKVFFSLIFGVAAFLIFNKFYFGSFLNQSIVAKSAIANKAPFLYLLPRVFFSSDYGIFVPLNISSLYVKHVAMFAMFSLAGICFFGALVYFVLREFKRADPQSKDVMLGMLILAFLVPPFYAYGGFIFSWYLLPSALFAGFMLIFGFISFLDSLAASLPKKTLAIASTLLLSGLMACQLLVDIYGGALNYYYYSDIGKYINANSSGKDSIMLEPLGVIPFFAQRYAHDEAGLASPLVTGYWKKYGANWWIPYLKDQSPTFLLEKDYITQDKTLTGSALLEDDKRWFNANYHLVREFKYDPANYPSISFINKFVSKLFKMGSNSVFYIYKKT